MNNQITFSQALEGYLLYADHRRLHQYVSQIPRLSK
jgi:hypothetical protein